MIANARARIREDFSGDIEVYEQQVLFSLSKSLKALANTMRS